MSSCLKGSFEPTGYDFDLFEFIWGRFPSVRGLFNALCESKCGVCFFLYVKGDLDCDVQNAMERNEESK